MKQIKKENTLWIIMRHAVHFRFITINNILVSCVYLVNVKLRV